VSTVDQALETQLKNLQARSGKTLDELYAALAASGLSKHGELRDQAKQAFGLGHGDANTLVHFFLKAAAPSAEAAPAGNDVLDEIYAGPKAALRPIHDRLLGALEAFGPFEIAPKKGYVSLRRKKQFAMVGPATKTRVEVGINHKSLEGTERLLAQAPNGMCQYKVNLTQPDEVDPELLSWLRTAYDSAG
jgi:hypothetical protein